MSVNVTNQKYKDFEGKSELGTDSSFIVIKLNSDPKVETKFKPSERIKWRFV